ncbi:hypothetical protein ACGFX4_34040 [Kitasatospora sp. NPDC048365]|uniref:hypothetical protein n=1 Tax=Kitasatospora sp. NPDC048365 TaxID=3364050 RepID=UPI00372102DB
MGLGNEVFPWAKAYLASRELGFGLLQPPWGLNPRDYRTEFGTPRLDWVGHAALRAVLPSETVTDEMVRSTGRIDYGEAIRVLDAEHGWSRRRALLLMHEGMSGGYLGIARARDFLRSRLLGRKPGQEGREPDPARLHVVVHIRLGDFGGTSAGPRPGEWNESVPVEWYRSVLAALRARLGDTLHVDILSDDQVRVAGLLPEWAREDSRRRSTLEDLSVMASADLLICSVSSYSMLAAFLSDAPYIWYRPHLGEHGGFLSIWGHEPDQRTGPTAANVLRERQDAADPALTRGVAMDTGDDLPGWLADYLGTRTALRRRSADLIHYGVVPRHAAVSNHRV